MKHWKSGGALVVAMSIWVGCPSTPSFGNGKVDCFTHEDCDEIGGFPGEFQCDLSIGLCIKADDATSDGGLGDGGVDGGCLGYELCNGLDDDCDGEIDEPPEGVCMTLGVCQDTVASCSGTDAGFVCNYNNYEVDETRCDTFDNDCDGTTDEGCPCTAGSSQLCGIAIGACTVGTQECGLNGTWGSCSGQGPNPELCNDIDDDCDGISDDLDVLADGFVCNNGLVCDGLETCTSGGCMPPDEKFPCPVQNTRCLGALYCTEPDGDCVQDPAPDGTNCGVGCVCSGGVRTEESCGDGLDNDEDGRTDCQDPDCEFSSDCPCVVYSDGGVPDGGKFDDGGFPDAGIVKQCAVEDGYRDGG